MLLKYDLCETARYMGYKYGEEPSKEICELIEISYKELCKVITPKYIYKEFKLTKFLNNLKVGENVKKIIIINGKKRAGKDY